MTSSTESVQLTTLRQTRYNDWALVRRTQVLKGKRQDCEKLNDFCDTQLNLSLVHLQHCTILCIRYFYMSYCILLHAVSNTLYP